MKILLIEDNEDKIEKITSFITSLGEAKTDLSTKKDLRSACKELLTNRYDLIIFDIFLPRNEMSIDDATDCSDDLIYHFSDSINYNSETLAISHYSFDSLDNSYLFNRHAIPVVEFLDDNSWQIALKLKFDKAKSKSNFDFIIFTALEKERTAFSMTDAEIGESINIDGMNCKEIKINNSFGLIIKPHSMGPIDMAITATKAIEKFQPKLVAISGICAGIEGQSNLLDIIVPDICWFLQSGKFKQGEFLPETRQIDIDSNLSTELEQTSELINSNKINIKNNLYHSELEKSKVIICPLVSSASVIADSSVLELASKSNRKVGGLDMEIFSVFNAAKSSLRKPLFFAAKSVVDLANASKGDSFHQTASIISARFTTYFIGEKLR